MTIIAMQRQKKLDEELAEIKGRVEALTDTCRYILDELRRMNKIIGADDAGSKKAK